MTEQLKTMEDLFTHEILDLYSAEKQIIEAFPKMIDQASNPDLKAAFEEHLAVTKEQKSRLEGICKELSIEMKDIICKGMQGLLAEGEELMKMKAEPEVLDAALIMAAQRVEHYEISGYGSAIAHAQLLGHENAVTVLLASLQEEEDTDEELSTLAEEEVNTEADSV
jgi:ferritin-like metal-binding protein YciE